MPHFILKPVKDEDFYVEWTTISDGPVAWGPRSTFYEEDRLRRADEQGTSAAFQPPWFAWDDDTWVYQHCGASAFGGLYEIPRENVAELCRRIDADPSQQFDLWDIANYLHYEDDE